MKGASQDQEIIPLSTTLKAKDPMTSLREMSQLDPIVLAHDLPLAKTIMESHWTFLYLQLDHLKDLVRCTDFSGFPASPPSHGSTR